MRQGLHTAVVWPASHSPERYSVPALQVRQILQVVTSEVLIPRHSPERYSEAGQSEKVLHWVHDTSVLSRPVVQVSPVL